MIRPATSADYPQIAQVSQHAMPQNPLTETQLKSRDSQVSPSGMMGYWVYEDDGRIIGFAHYIQWADVYDPQSFHIMVQVHPDHQRQSIGTELYATLADTLMAHNPQTFKSSIYEDNTGTIAFSQKYGFAEYSRRIDSVRDLTTFDPAGYDALLDKMTDDEGYEFRVLADILDDDTLREIYDLQWSLELDVPIEETLIKLPYQQWYTQTFENPTAASDTCIVAKQGDKYAGLAIVHKHDDTHLYCDFTGTRPHFRRQGVATAIKILTMQEGKQLGYQTISTTNDATNTGILALNKKLGFVAKPARIQIEKRLSD